MSDSNAPAPAPAPASQTAPSDPVAAPARTRLWKLFEKLKHVKGMVVAVAGVGAVLSGLVGYWTTYQTVKVGALPSKVAAVPASVAALSIVVLPFANQTGDAQKAYIADALTTSITSDLSRIRDAFVIPPATAFAYKDKTASVQQVGKDVGVRFVLHGSVLSSGERIRISVQLADAQSGAQQWSETLEGELTNLFALQDQVTTRIGNSIGREMVIVAARESETRKSSPKVADLMLRARALALKPRSLKNLQQEEAWYRQALMLEPNNARAMVGLANSLVLQAYNFLGSETDLTAREQKYIEGRDFALKGKELDPDDPDIYVALGVYAGSHDDFAGFRRAAETRLLLDPKNPLAYNGLAVTFRFGGEPKRAIELLTQAVGLDPKHPADVVLLNMGIAYFMLDDNDAAIEWSLKALEKNTAFPGPYAVLAQAYALKGDDAKARAAAAELLRLHPGFRFSKSTVSTTAEYKEWLEKKALPAWRKAGLPE